MLPRWFRNPIEKVLVDYSRHVVKPWTLKQPPDLGYLAQSLNATRRIDEIEVQTEKGVLLAYRMQLLENKAKAANAHKMAMIYMPGNSPHIKDSLPTIEPLMQRMLKTLESTDNMINLVAYCQHYRGRGTNRLHQDDNFHHYPMQQDAFDQAALIKTVLDAGYAPQDILVLGYSYGSAVAIWSVYELINQFGGEYAKIKIYSDRGFGNPFNFRFIKPFIWDQKASHKKLHEQGMMPALQLHEIVHQHLPHCVVTNIKNDNNIWLDFDLANSFENKKELVGRIFETRALHSSDPHFEDRARMSLKGVSELRPHHLMIAILTEKPLYLTFNSTMIKLLASQTKAYSLSANVHDKFSDFVVFPEINTELMRKHDDGIVVVTSVLEALMIQLDKYCQDKAERAAKSGLGGHYNHAWFGRSGFFGWTAMEQIKMATRMMTYLCDVDGPNIQQLSSLQNEHGPHKSGELVSIFSEIKDFIESYQWLQQFNSWVAAMSLKRHDVLTLSSRN